MKAHMDRQLHHQLVQRALDLGRSANPAAVSELARLLNTPIAEVRRLAASALGKLAAFGADAAVAVRALVPVALHDPHPQVQQYALKALKAYGAKVRNHLPDLDDLVANERTRDYVRHAAHSAAAAIREAIRLEAQNSRPQCARCGREVAPDAHARSRQAFQRVFCDACFDEVFLERRNFDTRVELNKTITAKAGTVVQSDGERRIADWLADHGIAYRYDERFRILSGHAIRPDFYLPEFDVYVEYWGMDTADYKIGMLKKQQLYQLEGKRLVSVHPTDKPQLDKVLRAKLALFGCHIAPSTACGVGERQRVSRADRPALQPRREPPSHP
jgi:RNase P subunit RPR2